MKKYIVKFLLNNAYDGYSADALNRLGDIIENQSFEGDECHLIVNDINSVLKVMYEYGFTFHHSLI